MQTQQREYRIASCGIVLPHSIKSAKNAQDTKVFGTGVSTLVAYFQKLVASCAPTYDNKRSNADAAALALHRAAVSCHTP